MPTGRTPLDNVESITMTPTYAGRIGASKDIYIAIRTDELGGSGTIQDPYNMGLSGVTASTAIQTVLNNAPQSSTIYVDSGTYSDANVTISKSVKIVGNRNAVFTQALGAGKPIFSVSGATTEFVLDGVTLQHGTGFRNELSYYAIKITAETDKVKLLNIYSSDFNNTIIADQPLNELIVRGCDFVYTYGRAGITDTPGAGHPTSPIAGSLIKRQIIQNNTMDGLLDSTFAGISGSPPLAQQVPADNFVQTGCNDYADISDNTIRNFNVEGIRIQKPAGNTTTEGVYSCRIADNHLVGPTYSNSSYNPAIVTDDVQASITGNTISNVPIGIQPKFDNYDEDLNITSVVGNTLLHVITGLDAHNCSSRSIFANNFVWNTSEPVRTVYGSITKPTNLYGIRIPTGTVANNVLLSDEPVWDASPTLVSRAANVFTLDSVVGIVANTGGFVSYADPAKVSFFPVEGISGNDVTVNSGWAASYPTITSGTLHYAENNSNAYSAGGIVVENGGTIYAYNNLVIGHLYDINLLNFGTIITGKHTARDNHYVQSESANFVREESDLSPQPSFSVVKTAAQTIQPTTFTKVTWESEVRDSNNNFASSRFTPTVEGIYQIEASGVLNSATAGSGFFVTIYKNGAEHKRGTEGFSSGAIATSRGSCQAQMNGATDYLEVYVYQRDSVARDLASPATTVYFQGTLMAKI